jgi:hypothetical protein
VSDSIGEPAVRTSTTDRMRVHGARTPWPVARNPAASIPYTWLRGDSYGIGREWARRFTRR